MRFSLGLLAGFVAVASAHPAIERRQNSDGFAVPASNGGSELTMGTYSGQGEPLNVIISSASSASVLTPAGFEEWASSVYFSPGSCFNITLGDAQAANLGDGNGSLNQTGLMRYNYMQGPTGTCGQSLNGGNHFRYWIQNGSAANTGAIFLAASVELPAQQNHMIAADGYDAGRDELVGNATRSGGTTSPGGFQYSVTVTDNASLMNGVTASQINHGIGTDGVVKVLNIQITKEGTIGANRNENSTGTGTSTSTPQSGASALLSGGVVTFASVALLVSTTLLF